jgi:FkbM family methyltransferase
MTFHRDSKAVPVSGGTLMHRLAGKLPPRLHDSLHMVWMATFRGELPLSVRPQLLAVAPRLLVGRARSDDLRLQLPGGPVYLGRESLYVDSCTLSYLWSERVFEATCRDRVVLDLGGHKGYFGVWALKNGASYVLSCEPQSDNFKLLERARAENARAEDWEVLRIAVGAQAGEVSLYVSPESWAHSIHAEMVDAVSVEKVEMVTLASLLETARQKRPGTPVVIKVNVEGSAGEILMAARTSELESVVEVHLDYEPDSPYELGEVLGHLKDAGLDQVHEVSDSVRVILRSNS